MRILHSAYICLFLYSCEQVGEHAPKILIDSTPPKNNNVVTIQKKTADIKVPVFEKAHPAAKLLLNESFYFNNPDEAGPFGNREGIDAYTAFYTWRLSHKRNNPEEFLLMQVNNLGYPKFDIRETDSVKAISYTQRHEFGNRFMAGIDAAVVGVAFGQLYLEGMMDRNLKEFAKIAITREILPDLLSFWGEPYKTERKKKFIKMLVVLNRLA